MKTGELLIDNVDVYTRWGVYVVEGGWKGFLSMGELKDVEMNDWQESDGVDVDLSAPVLGSREFDVQFGIRGDVDNYYSFLAMFSSSAEHTFRCNAIGRTFVLRLVGHTNLDIARQLGIMNVKFADDYPLSGYTYLSPTGGGMVASDEYIFDNKRFSDYGIRVLRGGVSEVMKGGEVKLGLFRDIRTESGGMYDSGVSVTYKSKEVKLECLLRASTLVEMWRNYYAFIYDLTRPNERLLWVDAVGDDYSCYYKSCDVEEFCCCVGRVWLKFNLVLVFSGGYRSDDVVLSTEDGVVIYTEDLSDAIEMKDV